MIQGQTSMRNGIQDFLFPMATLHISQGNNGSYSHQNQSALDLCGSDAGKDLAFAPADIVCVAVDRRNYAVTWQTKHPVRIASGAITHVTFTLMHDSDFSGIYVGAEYPQGHQIAMEGIGGNATGNHLHNENSLGKFTKQWEQNPKSKFLRLPNGVSADQVFFVDGTELLNGGNPVSSGDKMHWKTTADVPIVDIPAADVPLDDKDWIRIPEKATFTLGVEKINFRSAPSLNAPIAGFYSNGQSVHYDSYVKNDGYVWVSWVSASTGDRRYMACRVIATDEPWGTFKL